MSRTPRLVGDALAAALATLPAWTRAGEALRRRFELADFDAAVAFVVRVSGVARTLDHHPDVTIVWNVLTLDLRSHDAGGITERDVALARAVDALADDPFGP